MFKASHLMHIILEFSLRTCSLSHLVFFASEPTSLLHLGPFAFLFITLIVCLCSVASCHCFAVNIFLSLWSFEGFWTQRFDCSNDMPDDLNVDKNQFKHPDGVKYSYQDYIGLQEKGRKNSERNIIWILCVFQINIEHFSEFFF